MVVFNINELVVRRGVGEGLLHSSVSVLHIVPMYCG